MKQKQRGRGDTYCTRGNRVFRMLLCQYLGGSFLLMVLRLGLIQVAYGSFTSNCLIISIPASARRTAFINHARLPLTLR